MHINKAAFAVALSLVLATWLPSSAMAQLSSTERYKAEQLARIQAKANAEEQAKQRRSQIFSAKNSCSARGRDWDDVNETCGESRYYRRSKR